MNKKMRDLLEKINSKKVLAKSFMEEDNKDIKKANALLDEIDKLEEEYKAEERLYKLEKEQNAPSEEEFKTKKVINSKEKFGANVKSVVQKVLDLSEGSTSANVTVPEDISDEIDELVESEDDLSNEIEWKLKKTLSGNDRVKTRGQYEGFAALEEGGKIPKCGSPKYKAIPWKVTKYGGYLPVTNELLEDSDADVAKDMINWLVNECRVTRSKLVKAVINKKTPVDLKNLDGIKKAVNVDLDAAIADISKIITNPDGLNYLDTLKDSTGRPLLNPDPTAPKKYQLSCGTIVIPVKRYSKNILPSDGTKAPFIIGSLNEGIKGYKRKDLSLLSSNTATVGTGEEALNAYEEDLTLIRGITRLDAELRDEEAFINGYIDLATVSKEIVG